MAQLTLRLDDELANRLKSHARSRGTSVNRFAILLLQAAIDPELESTEAERLRQKLHRAGLLEQHLPERQTKLPTEDRLEQARSNAGRGTPLSNLVSSGRE